MKGDFSKWQFDEQNNFAGVLHQQGRVLLDADWNAQTRITSHWQDTAARDTIGPGVAAVPADDGDAFKVQEAKVVEGKIRVKLAPGRVWADGLLVHLEKEVELVADYFPSPIQEPPGTPNGEETRDAVILEVWREAANGFQETQSLIEPALGGPDTTERVRTAMALRLLRLGPGQACENIQRRLRADLISRPLLNVSLKSADESNGDCPTFEGGGYTGLEHHLYRIEIAETNRPEFMFKWSQFNGGLVGRGVFHIEGGETFINIRANNQAIATSGLERFYLEIVGKDPELGHSHVCYAAQVVLSGDRLTVEGGTYYEQNPPSAEEEVFFRLWDGIEDVSEYVVAITGPHPLNNGIELEFNPPPDRAVYRPGDYWTFSVRAGQYNNPRLIRWQPPEGVAYHRVPLAALHWTGEPEAAIKDCRRRFPPLTQQKACCSIMVGDGWSSHGDCDSIEEALTRLPPWGGEICLLPGVHNAGVEIEHKPNIIVKGCGLRTIVIPRRSGKPIFRIKDSWYITIENMVLGSWGGTAIQLEGSTHSALQRISIRDNHIFAFQHAIHARRGRHIYIQDNIIRMWDRARPGGAAAVFMLAMDSLIEGNNIGVIPVRVLAKAAEEEIDFAEDPDCLPDEAVEKHILNETKVIDKVLSYPVESNVHAEVLRAQGGLQIGSGSERIKILQNRIIGGAGNGITLGSSLDISSLLEEPISREMLNPIENSSGYISGFVQNRGGDRLKGIVLVFLKDDGKQFIITTTREDGFFNAEAEFGRYRAFSASLKYIITDVIDLRDLGFPSYQINVASFESEIDLMEVLDAASEISIEQNFIVGMGLSGIGTPQTNLVQLLHLWAERQDLLQQHPPLVFASTLAKKFGFLSGFILSMTIHRNHISKCLRALDSLGDALPAIRLLRGEGGISLGWCENLSICDNTIEENGPNHLHPVCGIFLSCGAQVDIVRNDIINNGPITSADTGLLNGIRGGIVLKMVTSMMIGETIDDLSEGLNALISIVANMGGHAARINDNLVKQPVGRALSILANGPVSVMNNQFVVDFAQNALNLPDLLAAAVLIVNLGRRARNPEGESTDASLLIHALFPGHTQFGHNRTRLSVNTNSLASQTLMTFDDLSFENNQSEVLTEQKMQTLITNTYLWADTLRAHFNLFDEPLVGEDWKFLIDDRCSLWTWSQRLNHTISNQGNHCVKAGSSIDGKKICAGNSAIGRDAEDCRNFGGCI